MTKIGTTLLFLWIATIKATAESRNDKSPFTVIARATPEAIHKNKIHRIHAKFKQIQNPQKFQRQYGLLHILANVRNDKVGRFA